MIQTNRRGFIVRAAQGSLVLGGMALLAACGGGAAAPASSAPASSAPASSAPASSAPASSAPASSAPASSASASAASPASASASAAAVTISMATNAVLGAKNAQGATWLHDWAIPTFEKQQAAAGHKVTVKVQYAGGSGSSYEKQRALDIQSKTGADVFDLDGPYVGQFVTSGYLKPLSDLVGASTVNSWEGWSQIPKAVQANMSFNGHRYGIPIGTDGRVLFYNKDIFKKAGLPVDWHPASWDDIIKAAETIKAKDSGVIPLQFNAGANSNFGEATTLQGFLPFLAGAGQLIYDEKTQKWQGNTPAMREALGFFQTIYSKGLASKAIQVNPQGRTVSFQQFAAGKLAVVLESQYLYESVLAPKGLAAMPTRNAAVGYTLIPAMKPGAGIRGQDFISLSGGGGRVINPYTKQPKAAWDLLTFLESKAAVEKFFTYEPIISAREDANATLKDPLLKFISSKVLPYTAYRPSLAVYPRVSADLQTMTQSVAEGKATPVQAAKTFAGQLAAISGIGAAHIANG
ncbi:MAG: extracellular solute-binding protein [Chloroflexota bacterium]